VSVTCVVIPVSGASVDFTLEALTRQTQPPERILAAGSPGELPAAISAMRESSGRWVWLVRAGAAPEPPALAELLRTAESLSEAPALVVSKVLTPTGFLDSDALPVPEVHRGERLLAALERRAVPLRVAPLVSALVRRDLAEQLEPKHLLGRDLDWTAQLLRGEVGLLVPTSVAVRSAHEQLPRQTQLLAALRLLRVLEPRERLWFAAYFGEQALRKLRSS
jgi:hypothetical protein